MTPLSLAHLSELDTPPLALLDLAAAAGFTSIGLRTVAASPGGIAYPLRRQAEQAELRRRAADTGIEILYIEMISLSRATVPADCLPALEAGAAIGATRLAVAGDDEIPIVAERLAELCDLARPFGIAVDLEFMPFRATKSLADANAVIRQAGRPNAHILLDALHFHRSNSSLADIDPALLGTVQLCDAPATPPADLIAEARTHRLLPGQGGLALHALLAGLPPAIPLGVELPLAGQFPHLTPTGRATLMVEHTRQFLSETRTP